MKVIDPIACLVILFKATAKEVALGNKYLVKEEVEFNSRQFSSFHNKPIIYSFQSRNNLFTKTLFCLEIVTLIH